MNTSPSTAPSSVYRCGSLTYTRRHLAVLFFWLLWGDMCFILMEHVVPNLMPIKFRALEASNSTIGIIMVTVPMVMNTILNPIISFRSDRYRSRWGRRIPFILGTLPFMTLCLFGMAHGDKLGHWVHSTGDTWLHDVSPNTVAVVVLGGVMALFSFFNTFVNAVFWYLFNDVVPEHLLARFMSWFRIVSLLTVSLYGLFIFPHAENHTAEILMGAGLLYFFGFGLMCLLIKEGTYPPPPPNADGKRGVVSSVKTFAKECHTHAHYWYLFLSSACKASAGSILIFNVLFYQGTGLSYAQIGKVSSTLTITAAVWIFISGWLADRVHPIRVVLGGQIMQLLLVFPVTCVWIFWTPPSQDMTFWVWLGITFLLVAPSKAFVEISDPPLLMRIFPRSRYGQFCSANSMWASMGAIAGGALSGIFLDLVKKHPDVSNPYAFIPVWQLLFTVPLFICTWKLYGSWKRYGGDQAYVAPLPEATAAAAKA